MTQFQSEVQRFIERAQVDLLEGVKEFPHVAGSLIGIVLLLLLPLFLAFSGPSVEPKKIEKTEKVSKVTESDADADRSEDLKTGSESDSPNKAAKARKVSAKK